MKVGDRIRCIDVANNSYLTLNKVYVILSFGYNELVINIRNDIGDAQVYFSSRFINITEERRKKLERLNNVYTV